MPVQFGKEHIKTKFKQVFTLTSGTYKKKLQLLKNVCPALLLSLIELLLRPD